MLFERGTLTHLSVQALLLRLQLTEGALELFQLTLKSRNFPLGQELLLLLHTFSITLAKTEGGRPPVMVNPTFTEEVLGTCGF